MLPGLSNSLVGLYTVMEVRMNTHHLSTAELNCKMALIGPSTIQFRAEVLLPDS